MFIGIILVAVGAGLCVYGNKLNNDIEAQLMSMFEKGQTNPGNMFLIIGAVVAVLGIALIIMRMLRKKK